MSNWYHLTKGQYNIEDETIRLDFGSHIGNTKELEATLVHEAIHAVLADHEFGQATRNAYVVIPKIKDLSEKERSEMMTILFEAQDFVQEGFATLMQFLWLSQEIGKREALELAENILPPLYLKRLKKFDFVFDLSARYRDFFTAKISVLAMETGIRETAATNDIFRDTPTLKNYLSNEDVNPNNRLEKLIDSVKSRAWLLTKPEEQIASESNISFHAPTSKKEVAGFMTYIASRMGDTRVYTEDDVGDRPDPDKFFSELPADVVLGNLNQKFSEQGEVVFKLEDFLYYADIANIIFVSPYRGSDEESKELAPFIAAKPEVVLGMIANTGSKYVTAVSIETAERILNAELKLPTLLVKEGAYNLATNKLLDSDDLRHPNFIIYNTAKNLFATLEQYLKDNPVARFSYFYAAMMEGHYLRTLYVKIEGQTPVHVVNVLGGINVDEIIELIKERGRTITTEEIRNEKDHYNNLLVFWMGMHKDVDWMKIMLDPEKGKLYLRDGTIFTPPSKQ